MDIRNEVAIITGASRGIGRATAIALSEAGFKIVANYRSRDQEANELVKKISSRGGEIKLFKAPMGSSDEARRLVQFTLETFGQVDVLINNAGITATGIPLGEFSEDGWEEMLRVNLSAPFYLIKAVLPHMRERKKGNIINLSSNVTQRFPAGYGPYTVSKVGLDALTRILSKEEGPNGIRVNSIAPGPIDTEMLQESFRILGPERAAALINAVPLRRKGRPEEIASVIRFLVSEAASYITGQVIYVNGGGPT
ncbi:MAG TPA: 3-oxoacyl-ACP reductase family protein [Candidatus Limnocylindrales bacterium]|nr:3-oxoacyl-ACP reductase family protein [Candidatus Limnocylindrales bacterium]